MTDNTMTLEGRLRGGVTGEELLAEFQKQLAAAQAAIKAEQDAERAKETELGDALYAAYCAYAEHKYPGLLARLENIGDPDVDSKAAYLNSIDRAFVELERIMGTAEMFLNAMDGVRESAPKAKQAVQGGVSDFKSWLDSIGK